MQETLTPELCPQQTLSGKNIPPAEKHETLETLETPETIDRNIGQRALFASQFEGSQETLPGLE